MKRTLLSFAVLAAAALSAAADNSGKKTNCPGLTAKVDFKYAPWGAEEGKNLCNGLVWYFADTVLRVPVAERRAEFLVAIDKEMLLPVQGLYEENLKLGQGVLEAFSKNDKAAAAQLGEFNKAIRTMAQYMERNQKMLINSKRVSKNTPTLPIINMGLIKSLQWKHRDVTMLDMLGKEELCSLAQHPICGKKNVPMLSLYDKEQGRALSDLYAKIKLEVSQSQNKAARAAAAVGEKQASAAVEQSLGAANLQGLKEGQGFDKAANKTDLGAVLAQPQAEMAGAKPAQYAIIDGKKYGLTLLSDVPETKAAAQAPVTEVKVEEVLKTFKDEQNGGNITGAATAPFAKDDLYEKRMANIAAEDQKDLDARKGNQEKYLARVKGAKEKYATESASIQKIRDPKTRGEALAEAAKIQDAEIKDAKKEYLGATEALGKRQSKEDKLREKRDDAFFRAETTYKNDFKGQQGSARQKIWDRDAKELSGSIAQKKMGEQIANVFKDLKKKEDALAGKYWVSVQDAQKDEKEIPDPKDTWVSFYDAELKNIPDAPAAPAAAPDDAEKFDPEAEMGKKAPKAGILRRIGL